MCGILGGINADFDGASLGRLHHRGPDQQCLACHEVADLGTVALGQTRLNIVDRFDIELPVRIGDAAIVFNGEVYNWIELRQELERIGWSFATKTDTEVVLAAYLEWGADCLERFNGMYALAIWDGRRFFCARDRLGKKPLFYRSGEGVFEFASEIKAFSKLEFVGQEVFDLFEFCFDEHTLYRDVFSLKPGHYLVYDPYRGTSYTRCYWDIEHRVGHRIAGEKAAVTAFLEILEDAVRLRLRSDVPVSLFLSGGLDSSLVAALSGIEEVFTCQFDEFRETINEEKYARDLAGRLDFAVNVVRPKREEFLADLAAMSYHLEMPTGSFSVFPLYCLARAAHHHGYKVVLSGEGSDELFAGYARNEFLLGEASDGENERQRHYVAMLRRYQGSDLDRFCRMASRSGLTGAAQMRAYLAGLWSEHRSMLENTCYVETKVFLQPLLQMADRMLMAQSVEGRCPFLDHRLVEFAFSLDDSLRFRDGTGKWIVHKAAEKVLPAGAMVLSRQVKDGLPTPVNLWMQGRHSFDRKYWNALLTAECMKSLLGSHRPPLSSDKPASRPEKRRSLVLVPSGRGVVEPAAPRNRIR